MVWSWNNWSHLIFEWYLIWYLFWVIWIGKFLVSHVLLIIIKSLILKLVKAVNISHTIEPYFKRLHIYHNVVIVVLWTEEDEGREDLNKGKQLNWEKKINFRLFCLFLLWVLLVAVLRFLLLCKFDEHLWKIIVSMALLTQTRLMKNKVVTKDIKI